MREVRRTMRGRGLERAGGDMLSSVTCDEDEVRLPVEFAGERFDRAIQGDFAHGLYY